MMASSVFRSCSLRLATAGVAAALVASVALADINNTGTVDCGKTNTRDSCSECCSDVVCGFRITCCPLEGPCTVINKPSPTTGLPLVNMKETAGGEKLQFVRKFGPAGVDVTFKVSILKNVFPKGLTLKARLTGNDAPIGALLYPIAFLQSGDRAPDLLHELGYDVAITGGSPTCQSLFPGQVCLDLALGLSRRIESALAGGIRAEVVAFQAGIQALDLAVCETTTTTTTTPTTSSSTTSTTTTGSSTTTIPCGLVPNGAAGVCGGGCPANFTCLLNAPNGNTCQCQPDKHVCGSSNCAGQCAVQFERCEPEPNGMGCGCCTPTGQPCSAATVCCSGESCDLATGTCPPPTTTTSAAGSTTTSTTSASTTSTTLCPPGDIVCSGVCVNPTSDNNNCGFCGHVCPFNTPVCIGGQCTIP